MKVNDIVKSCEYFNVFGIVVDIEIIMHNRICYVFSSNSEIRLFYMHDLKLVLKYDD